MRAPRLFWLLSSAGLALFVFSLVSAPTGSSIAIHTDEPRRPLEEPWAADVAIPAMAEASLEQAAAPQGATSPTAITSLPAGANASAPGKAASSVPQAPLPVRLSAACSAGDAAATAEKRKLLHPVPAAAEGGTPGCLRNTPICEALRHALAGEDASKAARRPSLRRHQLVVTSAAGGQQAELEAFTQAAAALRLPTLVLAMDAAAYAAARTTTAASVLLLAPPAAAGAGAGAGGGLLALKWAALAEVLEAGVEVLYADVDAVLAAPPFDLLHADTDFAGLSEGWEDIFLRGHVMGADDPSMGWSRYCESMRAALLAPSLFHLLPTHPAVALAQRMARQAARSGHAWPSATGAAWARDASEAAALSDELLLPAHDGVTRVGCKVRVLHADCWYTERRSLGSLHGKPNRPAALMVGRGRLSAATQLHDAAAGGGGVAPGVGPPDEQALAESRCRQRSAIGYLHRGEPLQSCWTSLTLPRPSPVWTLERTRVDPLMGHTVLAEATKRRTMQSRCERLPPDDPTLAGGAAKGGGAGAGGVGGTRRLNFLVQPGASEWPINCGEQAQLCEVVRKVHRDRAVMAAVSNRNILGMLGRFVDSVQKANVRNFLVVALDQDTSRFLTSRNAPHYVRQLRSRSGSTDNHATSGLKFRILRELLSVGVSVLLTDVDVVLTQDPFPALYRDSDAEGMTDGWDDESAYGHIHELPLHSKRAAPFAHGGGGWTAGGLPASSSSSSSSSSPSVSSSSSLSSSSASTAHVGPGGVRLDSGVRLSSPGEGALPPGYAGAPLRTVRMVARNSGLFYLSATHEALKLMDILARRMASEDVWDQSAYNMEVFRPAYADFETAGVSVRSHAPRPCQHPPSIRPSIRPSVLPPSSIFTPTSRPSCTGALDELPLLLQHQVRVQVHALRQGAGRPAAAPAGDGAHQLPPREGAAHGLGQPLLPPR